MNKPLHDLFNILWSISLAMLDYLIIQTNNTCSWQETVECTQKIPGKLVEKLNDF